jgi:Zn-dependent M28 family amino/carboxypeptidase
MTFCLAALALLNAQVSTKSWAHVDPDSALAHVRYLSSDELKGRDTPSAGLDKAADYIAEQFKEGGAQPGNGDSFFLEAEYTNRRSGKSGKVRSVLGVIPGSDSVLGSEYVLVTAHYDHLGQRGTAEDNIFNGANDNASGTVGLIEAAAAISSSPKKPKRSIMFVALWGEEKGLQGARAFVKNPPVALKNIVAVINLEQIGRTDDSEGERVMEANITGYSFSTLTNSIVDAAKPSGVKVTEHPKLSNPYFRASDNLIFAQAGIPAHTISTCYQFPDYHRATDHWDKINKRNFARIIEMVNLATLEVASQTKRPEWNLIPETSQYRQAYAELIGG